MEEMALPAGWMSENLGSVVSLKTGPFGSSLHKSDYVDGETPVVNPMHIINGSIVPDLNTTVGQSVLCRLREFKLEEGDVVLGRRGEMGRAAVVRKRESGWLCGTGSLVLRHFGVLEPDYLQRFLSSPFVVIALEGASVGSTMVNLNQGILKSLEIPIPPLNEQRRIAAKLDTTLAAVESCRQRLDGVAELFKRFRRAVLAAATSGELTREWREERGIADSWRIVSLSEVADSRLGKMLDQNKNTGQLTPYLRNVNVRWFSFDLEDVQQIRLGDKEIAELDVRFGDLLICEGGEPGRCAVWRGENSKYTFQKALHRVRTSRHLLADYLSYCLCNSANNGSLAELFTGSTIKHLTGASLRKFSVPLPSNEEQEEIIDRVESLFTLADQLEARLGTARKVVDRLTPALLTKAFRGELVPQDPNDEPASVLLERLRAARQAEAGAAKPSRRGRRKAAVRPDQPSLDAAPVPSDLLSTLLQECGALSERALLAASELEPRRFRAQLQQELQAGRIREEQEDGEKVLVSGG